MNTGVRRVLFWAPRVLCMFFAVFLSLFSLDVFSEGYGVLETILALFMHLVPSFLIVIALVVAWRWERIGAVAFILLALFLIMSSRGESWVVSGPLFLVGILFLFDWFFNKKALQNN